MSNSLLEKVSTYDKYGSMKLEVDNALGLLKKFRLEFPFTENPDSISTLSHDDVFKSQTGEVGSFFHWLEYYLKPLGHLTIYGSNVYQRIAAQLEDFKDLLYVAVDKKKSLAQKVDAPWENISGLGHDKHIAKKIIFCFNYENADVLPIFKTNHMEYFLDAIEHKPSSPAWYNSTGEKYEYLTDELLKVKESVPITGSWEITYFARFLYSAYPPPKIETLSVSGSERKKPQQISTEQIEYSEFLKLLGVLQRKGKIKGSDFIQYRESWKNQPQDRKTLTEHLKIKLNT